MRRWSALAGPSFFRSATAALSFPVGSRTTEQLALIDQYKASGWRKVWMLRLPKCAPTDASFNVTSGVRSAWERR
jgi:hypothetical protein